MQKFEKDRISANRTASILRISPPTVRRHARYLKIDFKKGLDIQDRERIRASIVKSPKIEKVSTNENLSIKQVEQLTGVAQGTIRSYIQTHSLGRENERGILILNKEEIRQIQENYKRFRSKQHKKPTIYDLVSKSNYLVYVPGVKQLSGFSNIEKIKEFVQNSLLTGQITVFKKMPARIDVNLKIE